ncbi:MAG: hypothetical protein ABIQ70_04845 [Dokdonella sp.]
MTNPGVRLFAVAALCAALCSCATGYQKESSALGTGGYTDSKIADGRYRITYLVNAFSSKAEALGFWHRRAKELCGNDTYWFHTTESFKEMKDGYNYHQFPYVDGTVDCRRARD